MYVVQIFVEWVVFVDFQIGLFLYVEVFGNGVVIIIDDLESIGVFGDKFSVVGVFENGQDVIWFDVELFFMYMG